jgi:DNA-binding transcriptional ArsR family regulator
MDAWAALADPTRRSIFELVVARPRAVGELAEVLPVTRPAVSQHLKLLKTAGLVLARAEGTRRIYRANPDGLGELRAQLDRFWNQALANLKQLVDDPEEDT